MTAVHAMEPSTRPADRSFDRPTFVAATQALDAAGVPWVRLRPRHEGTEDDLLVAAVALDLARAALAGAGFVFVPKLGRGSHRAFHAVDPESGTWLKIDIVTRIDFGRYAEVRTDLAAGFLARRRRDGDGWTLDPDDGFWSLLFHELLDKAAPVAARADDVAALAAHADATGPGARVATTTLSAGAGAQAMIDWAAARDIDALLRAGHRIRRRRTPGQAMRRLLNGLLRRLDRLEPPFVRRGLSIALLGPDGAGKSTLSHSVAVSGPLPVRSVYLGLYGGSRGRRRARLPGLGLLGRLTRMWRGWAVGALHVARGRIVIFDRHPYDARLRVVGAGRPSVGRRIQAHSLPAPDLVILLDAPAELLYARKPEHPLERLAAQRAAYLELARTLRRAEVVDVGGPVEGVARTVTAIAWRRLSERARAPLAR
jgi:thymidylate kinase